MEARRKRWSRYRLSEVLKYEITDPATGDSVKRHYLEARYPQRRTYSDSDLYFVKEGDELDQLAFRYYGKEELWWIIADTNRMDDPNDLRQGDVLEIPPMRIAGRYM